MRRRSFIGTVVGLLAAPLGFLKPARTPPENRYVLGCDIYPPILAPWFYLKTTSTTDGVVIDWIGLGN